MAKMYFGRFNILLIFLFTYNLHLRIGCMADKIGKNNCNKGVSLSKSVCIPEGYLKGEAPSKNTIVYTYIEINNLRAVNDKQMSISLDYYQDMRWVDNRIQTKFEAFEDISVLNNNLIDQIWMPDLWIQNLYAHELHSVLQPTGGLTIGKNCGKYKCIEEEEMHSTLIRYNLEALATIYCNFDFINYPMDTQTCEFVMDGAYPEPGVVQFELKHGQFGTTHKNTNTDDFEIDISFANKTQNPFGVHCTIKMKRCLLPFVIKYYLPCIAIIIVSLISFLISIDSLPARVALLVTQFLTLTNILIAQQAESPSSGKFTAIGIYLLTCLFFVVAGFIEFAIVLQLQRFNEKVTKTKSPIKDNSTTNFERCAVKENGSMNWEEHRYMDELEKGSGPSTNFEGCKLRLSKLTNSFRRRRMNAKDFEDYYETSQGKKFACRHKFDVRKIDIVAFGIVGVLFVIFNVMYWVTFLGAFDSQHLYTTEN